MKNKPIRGLTPDENLRADNELAALNLEMRYGATNHISDDAPPELIRQFLQNVTQYEAQYAQMPPLPVWDFIGQPAFPTSETLADTALEAEIERLLALLAEKNILIDRPEHLSPRGYYRFLTEDFFRHEMTAYAAPGLMHYFSYDEFRHDGPDFIKAHVGDFIQDLFGLDRPYEGIWLSEHLRGSTHTMTKDEVLSRINGFRAQYSAIKPLRFVPVDLKLMPTAMYFMFQAEWEGVAEGRPVRHEGLGICQLGFEEGEWLVQGITMPGFEF